MEGCSEDGGIESESFAFDPCGEGPYSDVSDSLIIKWQCSMDLFRRRSVPRHRPRQRTHAVLAVSVVPRAWQRRSRRGAGGS